MSRSKAVKLHASFFLAKLEQTESGESRTGVKGEDGGDAGPLDSASAMLCDSRGSSELVSWHKASKTGPWAPDSPHATSPRREEKVCLVVLALS